KSSVDILIPAAFPFPSLGLILALMFVLFGGWYVGSTVPVTQYPTLSIAGIARLFGGTVLALPFLFDLLRLPSDLFEVFVTVDAEPYTKDEMLASLHLIKNPQPHTVYREPPEEILGESGPPLSLGGIKQRGVLRACYMMDDYPSAFFNRNGELVGFDVEMTHQFARQLDLTLEFLPVRSITEGGQRVNTS